MNLMKSEFLNKNIFYLIFNALLGKRTNRVEGSGCRVNIKVVVAVNSCDFLDDIGFERNVLCCSPARNVNGEVVTVKLNLESECGKGFNDRVVVNLNTCVSVNEFLVKIEFNVVKLMSVLVRKT